MLAEIAGLEDLYTDIAGAGDPVDELLAVAGLDALVGAPARRGVSPQALQLAKARALVQARPPTAARNAVLGFGPTAVAAGGTATIVSAPQCLFRGEKMVWPSDICGSFRLTGLIVGQKNQLPNGNSIPGRAFDERSAGMEIVMDTAQPNSPISLAIVNTSLAQQTFEAALRGSMVL